MKKKRIYGPDGRPIEKSRARREPDPEQETKDEANKVEDNLAQQSVLGRSGMYRMFMDMAGLKIDVSAPSEKTEAPLEARVAQDLETIEFPEDFESGKKELEEPEKDLDTYVDAFSSAVKNCPHENLTDTLHNKEYQCIECGKYMTRLEAIENQRKQRRGFWPWS